MPPPRRLLLIDDETEFLDTMAQRLRRRGFEVTTARDCTGALAELARSTPDVVVLDVMLGADDGIACLREIKRLVPDLPVLLLTGHASLHTSLEGLEQGAADYCLKPIEIEELIERILVACKAAGRL